MEERKNIKEKALKFKREPDYEDVIEMFELLTPEDMKRLYFIIIGLLANRGYEFINR